MPSQKLNLHLNVDKHFKTANPREERFSGKYDDNWMIRRRNLLMHCQPYEVTAHAMARLFTMTITASYLTLFDPHFTIDAVYWRQIDFYLLSTLTLPLNKKNFRTSSYDRISWTTAKRVTQKKKP